MIRGAQIGADLSELGVSPRTDSDEPFTRRFSGAPETTTAIPNGPISPKSGSRSCRETAAGTLPSLELIFHDGQVRVSVRAISPLSFFDGCARNCVYIIRRLLEYEWDKSKESSPAQSVGWTRARGEEKTVPSSNHVECNTL